MNYSDLIINYRKKVGLTQGELAKGICTQSVISKMEKGLLNPGTDIFFAVVKRLNIPLSEIAGVFGLNEASAPSLLDETRYNNLLNKHDYVSIAREIAQIPQDILSVKEKLFYKFLEAVVLYHCYGKKEESTEELLRLEKKVSKGSALHLRILNSLVSTYMDMEEYDKAIYHLNILSPIITLTTDAHDALRFYYTAGRLFYFKEDRGRSLEYTNKGIQYAIDNDSTYILGELYLLKANIFYDNKLIDVAKEYCKKAFLIFEMKNDIVSLDIARNLQLLLAEGEKD